MSDGVVVYKDLDSGVIVFDEGLAGFWANLAGSSLGHHLDYPLLRLGVPLADDAVLREERKALDASASVDGVAAQGFSVGGTAPRWMTRFSHYFERATNFGGRPWAVDIFPAEPGDANVPAMLVEAARRLACLRGRILYTSVFTGEWRGEDAAARISASVRAQMSELTSEKRE